MTTLYISPFAPSRDGIAAYTVQEVAARRRAGEDVEVLSPLPSAAHHHLVIGSATGMVRLLRRLRDVDEIVVQAFPELLFGACRHRLERIVVWTLWELIARRVPVEFRIHEMDYATITADPLSTRAAVRALSRLARRTVHTDAERRALLDAAPGIGDVDLVDHGSHFAPRTELDRDEARGVLGLDPDTFVFLSIGFVQRHKGFDRAVRAFGRLADRVDDAQLHVVGDIRVDHPDLATYRDELDRLIASTPGCRRRDGYVGDAEFDRWLVAADCVVLPYRSIWSSGVVERARLFGTPMIVTDVGGLAEQAGDETDVVPDDHELVQAMARRLGVEVGDDDVSDVLDRNEIERLVQRRAGTIQADGVHRVTDHLGRVPLAVLGRPVSGRPGVSQIKQFIHRLTSWQLQPVAETVNELRQATIDAVEELEAGSGRESHER